MYFQTLYAGWADMDFNSLREEWFSRKRWRLAGSHGVNFCASAAGRSSHAEA